ncbi:HEAT repeat domain-containing protein [uncultured Modestobacter sp.]|uniref:HEAT repeat domain-containing protein n=1 Tax=uncultured Modestobacter sp. TaxID=380048 RepID=UPI00343EE500
MARRSKVSARMLRHYDSLGLVRPTGRTAGGYREYSADDVRRLFHVESLRSLGLSLDQVRRALADPAFTPSALVANLVRRSEERLRQEQELLGRLRAVAASTPTGWHDVLRIVQLMRGLDSPSAARRQQAVLTRPEAEHVPGELLAGAVLAESDPHVAGALRWALARSGEDGLAALAAGLRSPVADVRRRAVVAVAELPADTEPLLMEALTDPDPTVRGHAALAAGRLGMAAAVPALVGMVVAGSHDVEAAEVLGSLSQDPGCADRVMTALVDELAAPAAGSAVRIRLAQALVEVSGTRAREVLHRLTQDDDRAVARVASVFVGLVDDRLREAGKDTAADPPPASTPRSAPSGRPPGLSAWSRTWSGPRRRGTSGSPPGSAAPGCPGPGRTACRRPPGPGG